MFLLFVVGGGQVQRWWKKFGDHVDKLPWEVSTSATKYINELLTCPSKFLKVSSPTEEEDEEQGSSEPSAVPNPELEVLELSNWLFHDKGGGGGQNLVLPFTTRGMWEQLLQAIEPRDDKPQRFTVVGTPGVGKSSTIPYFIRQFINKRRQEPNPSSPIVVFECRKDRSVWLFAPEIEGSVDCQYEAFFVGLMQWEPRLSAALSNFSTCFIVDAAQAESTWMPALVNATSILVASPDPRHFSEFQKHLVRGFTVYCSMWTPDELVTAAPFMGTTLGEKELRERMAIVGPIPRRVLDDDVFRNFQTKLKASIPLQTRDFADIITGPETELFAEKDKDNRPRSTLFGFRVRKSDDGKWDYRDVHIDFVSKHARERLDGEMYEELLTRLSIKGGKRLGVCFGGVFEDLVFHQLSKPDNRSLRLTRIDDGSLDEIEISIAGEGIKVESGMKQEEIYDKIQNLAEYPRTGEVGPALLIGSNFPVCDVVVQRNLVLNATLNPKHSLSLKLVEQYRQKAGVDKHSELHLVYVLPQYLVNGFQYHERKYEDLTLKKLNCRVYKASLD